MGWKKKKTQKGKPSFKEENKCIPATYTYLDTSIMKVWKPIKILHHWTLLHSLETCSTAKHASLADLFPLARDWFRHGHMIKLWPVICEIVCQRDSEMVSLLLKKDQSKQDHFACVIIACWWCLELQQQCWTPFVGSGPKSKHAEDDRKEKRNTQWIIMTSLSHWVSQTWTCPWYVNLEYCYVRS